ncbi:MAG: bifunctional UDP-N-acetylglucosamine diphosphorylase/glucosamine-1-phosphate N-acetyltransferase GlmU [Paracoccaceae bacterium]
MDIAGIVLAAGKGTRMRSDRPKVLHEVAGASMLAHVLRGIAGLDPAATVVVTGHGADAVAAEARRIAPDARTAHQAEQKGTAHAVAQALPQLTDHDGPALILYGDTPLIAPDTLRALVDALSEHAVAVLGFEAADPARYGRLIVQGDRLERIVEWKDATEAERAVRLCNSGVIACDRALLAELVAQVGCDNAAGEYYLTDIVALAARRGLTATVVRCAEAETLGVNSRADLAAAEAAWQDRARRAAMDGGVTMQAPATVWLSHDTVLGADAVVEPNVVFGPGVIVAPGARIRAHSHLEGCTVATGASVGPFARLRPGTHVGEGAAIGNFVEAKNATLEAGAKAGHLTYLGDATIGAGANVGAGTVTVNFDGAGKHRTEVGAGAFVGSGSMLVAPLTVGVDAVTVAGSTITQDVADGAMAFGRAEQTTRQGLGARWLARQRARRAEAKGRG